MQIQERKATLLFWVVLAVCLMNPFFLSEASDKLPISTAEFPPFKYQDSKTGNIVGSDTEIIIEVFKRMGIKVDISMLPFARADALTRQGKFAAYYTFTKNAEREKDYYFSDPISSVQDFIFFKKSSNISWEKYEDLKDYVLGYSLKYNYDETFLNVIKNKIPITHEKNEEYLLNLLNYERYDMIICEASVCSYLIKENPEKYKNIVFFQKPVGIPEPRPFYIGFSKKWPGAKELKDNFNSTLKTFVSDPTNPRKSIFEKYGVQCPALLFPECE